MRAIAFVLATGCAAAAASVGDPDAGDAMIAPTWSFESPAGMQQLPERDVATAGTLELALRGFDQIATARDGAASLRIVPRRGGHAPMLLLAEPTGTRSLIWMLTPIGILWNNAVVWDDGTSDTGRLLYHVLEGGVLDATWTHAPVGTTLTVEMSAAPEMLAPALYRLGTIRVRVVAGTPSLAGGVLSIAPAAGRAQVVIYADPAFDTATVDAAGAVVGTLSGHVCEQAGAVVEKHVYFRSPVLELDRVLGLGSTPTSAPGPVVLADRAVLFVGDPDATSGWRIGALAVKIIKTGPIGMRRMFYANTPTGGPTVAGQTFNFYVFSPRGTVTLWPVARITAPYRLELYAGPARVVVARFPATENDYSEDLADGTDVLATRTAWAWDDTTLVEASTMHANVSLVHTGQEGNSVDGGWRHTVTGSLSTFRVGDAGGFATIDVPQDGYRFDPGDAFDASYAGVAVYHQQRAWTGAWAERARRVASLRVDATIYVGSIKDLHAGETLAAGSTLDVGQVLTIGTEDPSTLHDRYALPAATPLRGAMLDLDRGAPLRAPWDLAIAGDTVGVVFADHP